MRIELLQPARIAHSSNRAVLPPAAPSPLPRSSVTCIESRCWSSVLPGASSPQKKPTLAVGLLLSVGAMSYFVSSSWEMYLFLILFWGHAVAGPYDASNILFCNSRHSRFGEINSRLGSLKFPIKGATGILRKYLVCRIIFAAERRAQGQNRRNSRLNGKNREPHPRRSSRAPPTAGAGFKPRPRYALAASWLVPRSRARPSSALP